MKFKMLLGFLLAIIVSGCQAEMEGINGHESLTDTFILVDYHEGTYKFVQSNNEYIIGVEEGLVNIPEDFKAFECEKLRPYYSVQLEITGIENNRNVLYQKYTKESEYFRLRQASSYSSVSCSVERVEFYNDYLYYLVYDK